MGVDVISNGDGRCAEEGVGGCDGVGGCHVILMYHVSSALRSEVEWLRSALARKGIRVNSGLVCMGMMR